MWRTDLKTSLACIQEGSTAFLDCLDDGRIVKEHRTGVASLGAAAVWKPCICTPTREAAAEGQGQGQGLGHLLISCGSCHDELLRTKFYEPSCVVRHRQAGS